MIVALQLYDVPSILTLIWPLAEALYRCGPSGNRDASIQSVSPMMLFSPMHMSPDWHDAI